MAPAATCPHCGHAHEAEHQPANTPDVTMVCPRCQAPVQQPDGVGCAEWDQYCHEIPLPAEV